MRATIAPPPGAKADRKSRYGLDLLTLMMSLAPADRSPVMDSLSDPDLAVVMSVAFDQTGTPYGLWVDDPIGFVTYVLHETVWQGQRDILSSLVIPGVNKVAVPAGFGLGKTVVAAKAVTWFCSVNPPGTATAVTTATRMRQVERQLWPHVRRTVARAGLPGDCGVAQWKMPDAHDVDTVVAYGFTAPPHDEAAMQGIHAAKLMLVVDEAGGIDRAVGSSTRNLLTGDAVLLAIGNPPSDDEHSWFETLCIDGADADRTDTVTIPLPATASPAVTGEYVICRDCPPQIPEHSIGQHLVDQVWIDDAIREHGADAPYVVAKVHAKFPKGGSSRVIPSTYVEIGVEALVVQAPDDTDLPHQPVSRDRANQPYPQQPRMGASVSLGVDVAADGGDELAISRREDDIVRIRLVQSGSANENPTDVAGKVLEEIKAAEALADALGSNRQVRVKIDAIGIGWGICGILETWASERLHTAEIVRVVVSENPARPDDKNAVWRPKNKRAEMWLNGRNLLTPDPSGNVAIRLDVDDRCAAQLSGPTYGSDSSGRQFIESKKDMKRRGVTSPDRAEAVLLALYEPPGKKRVRVLA